MRSDSTRFDTLLRQTLPAHVVEDGDAGPNYSVAVQRVAQLGDGLLLLFEASTIAIRTRSPRRLARGLLQLLSGYATPLADDALQVEAMALVRDDRAAVVPSSLRGRLSRLEPWLRREGVRVYDEPILHIDPQTRELVVVEPPLDVDRAALERLEALLPQPRRPEPEVEPGRYALRCWFVDGAGAELSLADRVFRAAGSVRNRELLGGDRMLDMVAGSVSSLVCGALAPGSDGDVSRTLATLLRE